MTVPTWLSHRKSPAKVFEGVDWFHITGITPAISKSAMEPFLESVKEAKKRNITVSCDLNYRKNL